MSNLEQLESGGHTHAHAFDSKKVKREIWRITLYLSILTVVELLLGFLMMPWPEDSLKRHLVKGVVMALMLWKAFYIIGYFMHLRHEVRNMIMVIAIPSILFVWFIGAFLGDGQSYKDLRARMDPNHVERAQLPMEFPAEEGHEGHETPEVHKMEVPAATPAPAAAGTDTSKKAE